MNTSSQCGCCILPPKNSQSVISAAVSPWRSPWEGGWEACRGDAFPVLIPSGTACRGSDPPSQYRFLGVVELEPISRGAVEPDPHSFGAEGQCMHDTSSWEEGGHAWPEEQNQPTSSTQGSYREPGATSGSWEETHLNATAGILRFTL